MPVCVYLYPKMNFLPGSLITRSGSRVNPSTTDGLYMTSTGAHTHWELVREWLGEPCTVGGLPWITRRLGATGIYACDCIRVNTFESSQGLRHRGHCVRRGMQDTCLYLHVHLYLSILPTSFLTWGRVNADRTAVLRADPPTLYVEYAGGRTKYGILFIFSLFSEYSNIEYVHIHVIYRVYQVEYIICIPVTASQEHANTVSTRRPLTPRAACAIQDGS